MNGGDISVFVGLPIAAGLYHLFAKSIDVEAERRLAEAEAAQLVELAEQHRRGA